ncbi:cytochrome P450 [Kitasatospora sp. NBC_01287]|uniref:cytochrome P450 n=1 Tax=Kitasatospora sp. NBC_01287 TaxID=2903573 RepID=UPI002251361F|nr:cytochrome P450 [Kitasatospora sp. NBC_01287]MCX4745799.1 cytochrome P450 [Kitasatospora sp. NBC_01287]
MKSLVDGLTPAETALLSALSSEGRENPYAPLAELRRIAPVHHCRQDDLDTRFLTRFADCQAVLADPGFAVPDRSWLLRERPAWAGRPAADFFYSSLLGSNAAGHERLRRPVQRAFGTRRVAALSASVAEHVDTLLDQFADATAAGGAADFQALVGYPLAIGVVSELIGVPAAEQDRFQWLGQEAARLLEPVRTAADWERADQAVVALREYFDGLLRERRARPGEDLASSLQAHPAAAEPPLTGRELADLLLLVTVAGFETTGGLLGTAVFALLTHPEQLALLRADPGLLPGTVEESLRWDGPVLMTERLAARPMEVGGVVVPPGGSVTAVLGAANRDPTRYPDPDAFLVRRPNVRVLSFGAGAHHCLGAALARLEGAVLLERLFARFPTLGLAGPPVRRDSACLRSFDALPLATTD